MELGMCEFLFVFKETKYPNENKVSFYFSFKTILFAFKKKFLKYNLT
jgi:hypothetical protein